MYGSFRKEEDRPGRAAVAAESTAGVLTLGNMYASYRPKIRCKVWLLLCIHIPRSRYIRYSPLSSCTSRAVRIDGSNSTATFTMFDTKFLVFDTRFLVFTTKPIMFLTVHVVRAGDEMRSAVRSGTTEFSSTITRTIPAWIRPLCTRYPESAS